MNKRSVGNNISNTTVKAIGSLFEIYKTLEKASMGLLNG